MPVTLKSTSPETTYTRNSAFSLAGVTEVCVMHRFRVLNSVDFNDDLIRSNGSFGYNVLGGTSGQISARFRTNGSTTYTTIATGISDGDEIVIFTISRIGVDERHYVDGSLVSIKADPTSTAYLGNWQCWFQGSSQENRSFEIIERAEWFNKSADEADIAAYPTLALADFSVPPDFSNTPSGVNGVYASTLAAAIGSVDMDQTAGPTSGGLEPVYSGALDSLAIDFNQRFMNRTGLTTGVTRTIAGDYEGTIESPLNFRVLQDGSPVSGLDWQVGPDLVIADGRWSITVGEIPNGKDYVLQVADSSLAQVSATTPLFNVGRIAFLFGQSQSQNQNSGVPTTPVVANDSCWIWHDSEWRQATVALQHLANALSDIDGIPTAVINASLGGTAIGLLEPGSDRWNNVVVPILTAVGDFELIAFEHGESNVNTAVPEYKAALSAIHAGCLALNGRTTSTFAFLETQVGVVTTGASDVTWPQMRNTQKDWAEETAGAYFAAITTDAEMLGDGLHYTNDFNVVIDDRIAKTYSHVLGVSANDGVGAATQSFSINGNDLIVSIDLNGATGITKSSSAAATGWLAYSDDSLATALTITDVQISGNNVVITTAETPTPTAIVRHLYQGNPDRSNLIYATGYDIDDIGLQMSHVEYAAPVVNDNIQLNATAAFNADLVLNSVALINDALTLNASAGISSELLLDDASLIDDAIDLSIAMGMSAGLALSDSALVSDAINVAAAFGLAADFALDSAVLVDDSLLVDAATALGAALVLGPNDGILDAFNLGGPVSAGDLSSIYNAAIFTITGATPGVDLVVVPTNGEVAINSGAFTANATTAQNGDVVKFRITSAGEYATQVTGTLAINEVSDAFAVTTREAPLYVRGPFDPFDTRLIEARLKEAQFGFETVAGAADYAAIKDIGSCRVGTAYVVLAREENAANNLPQARNKTVASVTFGVICVARNYRDVSGSAAKHDVSAIVGNSRKALRGWAPEGCTPCIWQQGDVLDYDRSNLLWIDVYSTTHVLGGDL